MYYDLLTVEDIWRHRAVRLLTSVLTMEEVEELVEVWIWVTWATLEPWHLSKYNKLLRVSVLVSITVYLSAVTTCSLLTVWHLQIDVSQSVTDSYWHLLPVVSLSLTATDTCCPLSLHSQRLFSYCNDRWVWLSMVILSHQCKQWTSPFWGSPLVAAANAPLLVTAINIRKRGWVGILGSNSVSETKKLYYYSPHGE